MKKQEKLRQQAQMDALTGILNVGAGRSKIQKILDYSKTEQKAMFMMDVDNFKTVNDTYRHNVGDKILKKFAEILSTVFCEDAVVYRIGGDEFSVFLSPVYNAEQKIPALMRQFHLEVQKARTKFPFLVSV